MTLARARGSKWLAYVVALSCATHTASALGTGSMGNGGDARGSKDTRGGRDSDFTTPVVKIWVDADSMGSWGVTEWFALPAGAGALPNGDTSRGALRFLARACSSIDTVSLVRGDVTTRLTAAPRGPWRLLRDSGGGTRFDLRYAVERSGGIVDVPLVVPDRPIPKGDGDRAGSIEVVVRLRGVRGR